MTLAMSAAVPSSIGMKRSQDFMDPGDSPINPDEIRSNPIKLLNSLTAAAAANDRKKKPRLEDHDNSDSFGSTEITDSPDKTKRDIESESDGPLVNGPSGFPCIWLNGNGPSRESEGGEKSPNPPPPQLALPHETEGASTERAVPVSACSPAGESRLLSPGQTLLDPKYVPGCAPLVIQPIDTPIKGLLPRNPFEGRPGLEALFKNGRTTPNSDGEGSDADSGAEVCPECHKVFKRKVYLQRHMEREHWSTAKVFKCDDCSYETKHQSNLSVHRRTHTGERPYHCGACGQRYTQGHLLKSHIRSRHGGNMEFYNLDKKSDSTRGRKSLDMKHEIGTGSAKVDKISALLQAAANGSNPNSRQTMAPPPPMPHKFGNLLNPPLGGLPYFGGLRPMMTPMSLASSLMGGPRFFNLGGMANGLPPPPFLPGAGMPLLGDAPCPSLTTSPGKMHSPQLKKKEMSSPSRPAGESTPVKTPMSTPEKPSQDTSIPQDLSMKREVKTPEPCKTPEINMGQFASAPYVQTVPSPTDALENDFDEEALKENQLNHLEEKEKTLVAKPQRHGCHGDRCQHLMKLQNLRRNVFRMLSTFTPDLSDENGISNDGDDVDELLHEVMYSNIDETFMGAKD